MTWSCLCLYTWMYTPLYSSDSHCLHRPWPGKINEVGCFKQYPLYPLGQLLWDTSVICHSPTFCFQSLITGLPFRIQRSLALYLYWQHSFHDYQLQNQILSTCQRNVLSTPCSKCTQSHFFWSTNLQRYGKFSSKATGNGPRSAMAMGH